MRLILEVDTETNGRWMRWTDEDLDTDKHIDETFRELRALIREWRLADSKNKS